MINKMLVLFVILFSIAGVSFAESTMDEGLYKISYDLFRGRKMGLEVDLNTGEVALWVHVGHSKNIDMFLDGRVALDFLRKQVLYIVLVGKPLKLGNSNICIHFQTGYPIWNPYIRYREGDKFQYLQFAGNIKVIDNVIVVQGRKNRIASHDGYQLREP